MNTQKSMMNRIMRIKKEIAITVGAVIAILVISFGVAQNIAEAFNPYVFFFAFFALVSVVLIVVGCRMKTDGIAEIFALLMLSIGMAMILVSPFGFTCWDTDSHYKWALCASHFGKEVPITEADLMVLSAAQEFMDIPESLQEQYTQIGMMNTKTAIAWTIENEFSLPHVPSGIMLALLRWIGFSFYRMYTLGKIPNLLIYTLCCYFGIKKLKSGKSIFAIIALFPTNLFLACNYSYDYWVNGFSMLGMAYFVGCIQDKENPISLKDTIIMCAAFGLADIPKYLYIMLLLIPFFMPPKKIKNKLQYYGICSGVLIMIGIIMIVASVGVASGPGDVRGGDVDPSGQIALIFQQPLRYTAILLNFLRGYLSVDNMIGYTSFWAYIGFGSYSAWINILLLFAMFADRTAVDENTYSRPLRAFVLLMLFAESAVVATSMYVAFTPLGHDEINGCQTRYLLPLIYPVASVVAGKGIAAIRDQKKFTYLCISVCGVIAWIDIYRMMLTPLMR